LKSWINEKHRNKVTGERKKLYVASVPKIDRKAEYMQDWTGINAAKVVGEGHAPKRTKGSNAVVGMDTNDLRSPDVAKVISYLQAFYHGFEVKGFPEQLTWTTWPSTTGANPVKGGVPKYIALQRGKKNYLTRIRARRPPDYVFPAQLNLDDVLDAAIAMLPKDTYALLLLVDHDLYEDEENDFCCGRAYGGSRICVVQSARYHPGLDP
jgi:archaemetzincin